MFKGISSNVIMDLLFALLLIFVVLFFLAFIMVSTKEEEQEAAKNDNHFLIALRWKTNNDIDLWLRLPDGRRVGYNQRDMPPAHLDVDVVMWRKYRDNLGAETIIEDNEEVITVRDLLFGEYTVNVHYYSRQQLEDPTTEIELFIQDIKNRNIVYLTREVVDAPGVETHIVRFTVVDRSTKDHAGNKMYRVGNVDNSRPMYFIKNKNGTTGPDPELGGDE